VGTSSELVDGAFRCQGNHHFYPPAATAYSILGYVLTTLWHYMSEMLKV